MLRRLFTIACLLSSCASARAADQVELDCERRLPATSIQVNLVAPEPVFDYSLSTQQLTAKSPHGPHNRTLGLTEAHRQMVVEQSGTQLAFSGGRACVRPRIEMTVTLALRVYVGREFAQHSCGFNEVLNHEMRHVATHREHAARVTRALEVEMRKAFANDIYYGQADTLSKDLNEAIKTGWFPHLKAALDQVNALQAQIDTPAEYARLGASCNGDIARLVAPSH